MKIEIFLNQNYVKENYSQYPSIIESDRKEKTFRYVCQWSSLDIKTFDVTLEANIGGGWTIFLHKLPLIVSDFGFGLFKRLQMARSSLMQLTKAENEFNRTMIEEFINQKKVIWKPSLEIPHIRIIITNEEYTAAYFIPPYMIKQRNIAGKDLPCKGSQSISL